MRYLDFIVLKENVGLEIVDSLIDDVWLDAWKKKKAPINTSVQCIWMDLPYTLNETLGFSLFL